MNPGYVGPGGASVSRRMAWGAAAVLLVMGSPAWAAGDSNAALLRELHELRSEVHTLAARVDKLEQMQHPAAASAAAPAQSQQPTELNTEVHELPSALALNGICSKAVPSQSSKTIMEFCIAATFGTMSLLSWFAC